jgi:transcriptional regulator NrdR family protein
MLFQTACARCRKVGLVRFEREITGTNITRNYYCGYCEHRWTTPEELAQQPPILLADRRKRSRHERK